MGSGEVLRDQGRRTAPIQPMRKRTIVEGDTAEPEFGCPMLTRTRLALPFRGNQQVPRCSVGWAVHDEDEVLFCMHTPSRNLCWKENPEQLESLVEKLRPQIQAARRQVPQVSFSLDMRLGARAGFKRNDVIVALRDR